ncbi:hypothetical protein F955_02869, partial [Acinetobacter schindleri CIP 107287]
MFIKINQTAFSVHCHIGSLE